MTYNTRGQCMTYVNNSVEEGENRESFFLDHLESKNIKLIKKSTFKHYDFDVNKNIKIELKTSNFRSDRYDNVFIGLDKICYYAYRKKKNENLIFILIYGFYDISTENDKTNVNVKYLFDIIDIDKYLYEYGRYVHYNKKHIKIPVNTLKPLKYLTKALKSKYDTNNDFLENLKDIISHRHQ